MRALTQLQKACCCEQHRGGMMGDLSREGSLYKVGFIEAKTYNRKAVRATHTKKIIQTTLYLIMKPVVGLINMATTSHFPNLDKPLCPISLFQLTHYSLLLLFLFSHKITKAFTPDHR